MIYEKYNIFKTETKFFEYLYIVFFNQYYAVKKMTFLRINFSNIFHFY